MNMRRKHSFAFGAFFIGFLMLGLFFLPELIDRGTLPDSDEIWYTSGPYELWQNESYSVLFREVNFTFLYYERKPIDSPSPAYFAIIFADGTIERLSISIPGLVLFDDVVRSNHTAPQAALYTHGSSDVLWKWYCAVSLE